MNCLDFIDVFSRVCKSSLLLVSDAGLLMTIGADAHLIGSSVLRRYGSVGGTLVI